MQRELESFLPTLRTIHEQLLAVCSYLPTPVGACVLVAPTHLPTDSGVRVSGLRCAVLHFGVIVRE